MESKDDLPRENLPAEVQKLMTEDLLKAFDEIQMARSPYVLKHFVVGQHDTEEQRYAQCVLELQIKYDVIRRAILGREKVGLQKERLDAEAKKLREKGKPNEARQKEIDAQIKLIDVEEQDRAMTGALREFTALYAIFKTFNKQYTRKDLDKAQPEYWDKRLTRQANQDMLAIGRISVGNADALRMIGKSPVPELDHIRSVEQRYLETSDCKVIMAVPTEFKAEDGLPCLDGLVIPSGVRVRYLNVFGRKVDEAYNYAVMEALKDGANFLLTVEDDTFPPIDAFAKLLKYARENPKTIWGAWYPKKQEFPEGTPIVIENGHRKALDSDGKIHECMTLPMGCSIYPTEVFLQINSPWFKTTEHMTQDSFFSQLAREVGWKLMCDTSIICRHVDRITKKIYGGDEKSEYCGTRISTSKEVSYSKADGEKTEETIPSVSSNEVQSKESAKEAKEKIVLHIGCGPKNPELLPSDFRGNGWRELRLDIDPSVEPDIVASTSKMDMLPDNYADAVWSSHNLEHLPYHEVATALKEILRVLKTNGVLVLTLPDITSVCQAVLQHGIDTPLFESQVGPISAIDMLYGHRGYIENGKEHWRHKTGFTKASLEKFLSLTGFKDIEIKSENFDLWVNAFKR